MSAPRLSELLAGIANVPTAADIAVRGLSLDSRRIAPGDLFVALPGSRGHGLAHAAQALAAGAAGIVFEPPGTAPEANVPVLAVPPSALSLPATDPVVVMSACHPTQTRD